MAATHWLDISLTLDSITWHFGNFGEPQPVAETEVGLRELGLHDLASCFAEAKELMIPLLARPAEAEAILTRSLSERASRNAPRMMEGSPPRRERFPGHLHAAVQPQQLEARARC